MIKHNVTTKAVYYIFAGNNLSFILIQEKGPEFVAIQHIHYREHIQHKAKLLLLLFFHKEKLLGL